MQAVYKGRCSAPSVMHQTPQTTDTSNNGISFPVQRSTRPFKPSAVDPLRETLQSIAIVKQSLSIVPGRPVAQLLNKAPAINSGHHQA